MMSELKKIKVFFYRDFKILLSYKVAFSMSFMNVIFSLFYFVLFGSMFKYAEISVLNPYGGNFIEYILIGSIGWGFLTSIMSSASGAIRTEMQIGTLESILLTPTKIITMILAYALFGSFFGFVSVIILLASGYFIFGIAVFSGSSSFTVLIFTLSMITMIGFGLIFSGLTIWVKNIGSAVGIFQNVAMFFSGVFFPLSVIPEIIRPLYSINPFYYSIEGIRQSLLSTTTASELWGYVWPLIVFSIIFVIFGFLVLDTGLKKAKKDGSLMYY